MRYFIIAGEASGDLHGSGLVRQLISVDTKAEIQCWGGDKMAEAGATVLKHYKELAFMGFVEVVMNLPTILRNFKIVKTQIETFAPDVIVLVDYPGFNLRLAKWAHEAGYKVHYYISPQAWAWKEKRVEDVRRYVDEMYVILPFEKGFYERHGIDVHYVGHPLLEAIARYREGRDSVSRDEREVAILAGSRKQEIRKMLPVMAAVSERFPKLRFTIAAAPSIDSEFYHQLLPDIGKSNIGIVHDDTYGLLDRAHAALTTSGTATLETALFNVPQVVCYRGSRLSFEIARRLIRVPFISLVNLIAAKPVVEELIQDNMNVDKLTQALDAILSGEMRQAILEDYRALETHLDEGGASRKVAKSIYKAVK